MATTTIPLDFTRDQLEVLYAYPNTPGDDEPLEVTVEHWIGQSLERDGFQADMVEVSGDGQLAVHLDGPTEEACAAYAARLPKILEYGWEAYGVIPELEKLGKWDPAKTGQWRFFLTLGVGIYDFRSLQFFHYPPARLLNPLRDSMKDPVTYRCKDLLVVNGVTDHRRYETRINSTPIAAPDDQGTNDSPLASPIWGGFIPIAFFREFERKMIRLLLSEHHEHPGYTIPMIVYGQDPRQRFGGMFLGPDSALTVEIIPGLRTPVLGSNHPYHFYYQIQEAGDSGGKVGSGKIIPENCPYAVQLMRDDLAVVYWQVKMAEDPSRDPLEVRDAAIAYWSDPARDDLVCGLVRRQGSLEYKDPDGYEFDFRIASIEAAVKACQEAGDRPCAECASVREAAGPRPGGTGSGGGGSDRAASDTVGTGPDSSSAG